MLEPGFSLCQVSWAYVGSRLRVWGKELRNGRAAPKASKFDIKKKMRSLGNTDSVRASEDWWGGAGWGGVGCFAPKLHAESGTCSPT